MSFAFHETVMGGRFFSGQLPTLINHLGNIARELKRSNDAKAELSRHSGPHEVLEAWEVRVGRDVFEQLQCPNEDCMHIFLVDMNDLDAGAAAWVWCPLCKAHTPLHVEEGL